MKQIVFIAFLFFVYQNINAQTYTPEDYIKQYKDAAIAEMKRSGVPASVTLAQGILETESGNSELVKKSNNHFGIKCKSDWKGESVKHTDDAYNECFRKYTTAADSYKDHSDYLKNTPRYANLFSLPKDDYKGWAFGLKRAGYATNPRYPQILISNIEKYNLQQYDNFNNESNTIINTTFNETTIKKSDITISDNLISAIKSKSKINGLKALFVSKGTSLLAIATAADIALSKLMEYNDISIDGILKDDQIIYLEKKNKLGNRDIYTSLENETLYDVAQVTAIQIKSLVQLNRISENQIIKKGEKLKLR